MARNEAKVRFVAETEGLTAGISKVNGANKELRSELKLVDAQMRSGGESASLLEQRQRILGEQAANTAEKAAMLQQKLEAAERAFGTGSAEAERLRTSLNYVRVDQEKLAAEMASTTARLEAQAAAERSSESALDKLTATIGRQKAEVARLEGEYKSAVVQFGRSSAEARQLESGLSRANSELAQSEAKMQEAERAAKDLAYGLDDAADSARDAGSSIGDIAAGNMLADMAGGAASALAGLSEATEENRAAMNRLGVAYEWSGRSIDEARDVYQGFLGLCGDSGQAVEAAQLMNNLADAGASIDEWYGIAAGTTAAFGDALPIESLIESANETVRCGTVTGGLADALNWTAISQARLNDQLGDHPAVMGAYNEAVAEGASQEDAMNAALAACSSEQERQEVLTAALLQQYGELGAGFAEVNSDIDAARRANDDLVQAQSQLAEQVAPLQTAVTQLAADGIGLLAGNLQTVVPVVVGLGTALGGLWLVMNGASVIQGVATSFGALNAVMAANPVGIVVVAVAGLVAGIITLWNTSEEFRVFWIGVWDGVRAAAGDARAWVEGNVIQPMSTGFGQFCEFINLLFSDPFAALRVAGEGIIAWFSSRFPGVSSTVGSVIRAAQAFFSDPFGALRSAGDAVVAAIGARFPGVSSTVGSVIGAVKGFLADPFAPLRNAVDSAVSWFKRTFRLEIPPIKMPPLPHPKISGSFSLNPPSVPHISVEWYARAMDTATVLTGPTIFGAAGGSLLGGGEAGREVVSGEGHLIGLIEAAVSRNVDRSGIDRVVAAIRRLDDGLGGKIRDNSPRFPDERQFGRMARKAVER